MTTVLVTGGAGFVGSTLAIGLRSHREGRFIALDNLKRRGSELNISRLRAAGVEFVHGDIRAPEDLELPDIDVIVECSAEPSVLAGYTTAPSYVVNTNLGGTVNCLELARRCRADVVFLSTSRVYPIAPINQLAYHETDTRFVLDDVQALAGASGRGLTEAFTLEGARSLYGATKLCSELLLREYGEMYGIRTVVNRCGVLAGPWQMGKVDQGVIALWAARHLYGGQLQYVGFGGEGRQVRDVLHVDDLLRLVEYELDHFDVVDGETFNVGGGVEVSTSLQELTATCRVATGVELPIGSDPVTRPADVRIYLTDNGRVSGRTGWRPEKTVGEIVDDVCGWLRDHQAVLAPILA